jgi:16S rRNA (uracil1498-N3)-methyltransferase
VPGLDPREPVIALPRDESHHLCHVLRLRAGDPVRVFDGLGREWSARVRQTSKSRASVEIIEPVSPAAEWDVAVVVALAVLKGDRMDAAVRDATMLGAWAVQPVMTAHTSVPPAAVVAPGLRERWHRIAVASAKQCGRAVVPDVRAVVDWDTCLERDRPAVGLLLVEPGAAASDVAIDALAGTARAGGALVAVGPEGGWSAGEIDRARRAGLLPWSLGDLTLRADAVPLAALAVLRYAWSAPGRHDLT